MEYPPTPFPTYATNASIDKVIFQIERLSGQVNELTGNVFFYLSIHLKFGCQVGEAANDIVDRGKETVERLKFNFQEDTISQVNAMLVS